MSEMELVEDELARYDEIVARQGARRDRRARVEVADALVHKGCLLDDLGRSDEAITVFDDVLARFGEAAVDAGLAEQVARALGNKGAILASSGLYRDAVA